MEELNYTLSPETKAYFDAILLIERANEKASDAILKQYGEKVAEEFSDRIFAIKDELKSFVFQSFDGNTNDFVLGKIHSNNVTI